MFNLSDEFVAQTHTSPRVQRNFGLRLPPDIPRTKPLRSPPRVYWPDIVLAFTAGLICVGLGVIGAIWMFGG